MTVAHGLLRYLPHDGSGLYADGGTRTHKSWGTPAPKAGAFASFATSAGGRNRRSLGAVVRATAGCYLDPHPTTGGGSASAGATVLLLPVVLTPFYKAVGGPLRLTEHICASQQGGYQTGPHFLGVAVRLEATLLHRRHQLHDGQGLGGCAQRGDRRINERASACAPCVGCGAVAGVWSGAGESFEGVDSVEHLRPLLV